MSDEPRSPDATTPPSTPESDPDKCGRSCRGGRRRHWRKGLIAAGLIALAAFAIPRAFAHGWGGGCDHDSSWTREGVRDHMGWVAGRALDRADGTDEQEKQVDTILDRAAPDVVAFHEEARGMHADLRDALTAPAVDRAALEAVRKDALDLADRASARAMETLAELANVFTPEQREKLARGWAERHGEK